MVFVVRNRLSSVNPRANSKYGNDSYNRYSVFSFTEWEIRGTSA